jgi:hypothetical protein
MQPLHATSDMLSADRYWGDRVATAYAWNALESNAARLVFGSDAPVESPNPFLGIHAAATRRRLNGDPGPAGWTPSQRIRIQSALHAYTQGAAYAAGLEDQQGWLGAGTLADLIVLDQELLQLDPHTIASIQPRATMVNGEWMWRSF